MCPESCFCCYSLPWKGSLRFPTAIDNYRSCNQDCCSKTWVSYLYIYSADVFNDIKCSQLCIVEISNFQWVIVQCKSFCDYGGVIRSVKLLIMANPLEYCNLMYINQFWWGWCETNRRRHGNYYVREENRFFREMSQFYCCLRVLSDSMWIMYTSSGVANIKVTSWRLGINLCDSADIGAYCHSYYH